ncbi:helix-turn-helix domain-containing protein [Mucilaginibacter sp. JRF]|uniref:AraC family transcriptional regulator n=1 Tax=Mucilaginibacter sp. JRF TaxID=2780088 RepID=UPI0018805997|nr:AraC family transcriptional regulator [Mucilaginibacter sp. JRF]MBE9585102.1 helix-turn-helix domain-containing protein [Mucilaginibacter sp. JRF]
MFKNVSREITPLTQSDCFTIFTREKQEFNFPLHNHEEMELNMILNAAGAKRIVGDHIDEITDMELVLVGPNLPHGWFTHHCKSPLITEVTIQFHKDLMDDRFLKRNQLNFIRNMIEAAKKGIMFSRKTIEHIAPRILALNKQAGFDSILELFAIFNELSIARDYRTLSDSTFLHKQDNYNSRRIERVFEYMNTNFHKQITLDEVSKIANMPSASFSRFIRKRTGSTFISSLNEIRLGHVSRMLIDTTHSVSEIAYKCGFNNMANFNRTFKNKKGCTPNEFRDNYSDNRVFV